MSLSNNSLYKLCNYVIIVIGDTNVKIHSSLIPILWWYQVLIQIQYQHYLSPFVCIFSLYHIFIQSKTTWMAWHAFVHTQSITHLVLNTIDTNSQTTLYHIKMYISGITITSEILHNNNGVSVTWLISTILSCKIQCVPNICCILLTARRLMKSFSLAVPSKWSLGA